MIEWQAKKDNVKRGYFIGQHEPLDIIAENVKTKDLARVIADLPNHLRDAYEATQIALTAFNLMRAGETYESHPDKDAFDYLESLLNMMLLRFSCALDEIEPETAQ